MKTSEPTSDQKEFGKLLRARREGRSWTQQYVAGIVGVTKGAISHWEQGRVATISAGNLMGLSRLYGLEGNPLIDQLINTLGQNAKSVDTSDIPPHRLDLIRMYGRLPKEVRTPIRTLIETLAAMHSAEYKEFEKTLAAKSAEIRKRDHADAKTHAKRGAGDRRRS